MNCHDNEILSIGPIKDIIDILGRDFIEYYVDERMKKNKTSRTLRVKSREVEDEWFLQHSEQKRIARFLPESADIKSMIMTYDDIVSIIPPKEENIGIVLKSKEVSQAFKEIFKLLWSQAEIIK